MASATFKIGFATDRQMKTFLRLLRAMQYCGNVGHSTAFNVGVDGDGGFDMDVEVISDNGEKTNLRDVVRLDSEMYEQAKKDHKRWCPESKCDMAFGFE